MIQPMLQARVNNASRVVEQRMKNPSKRQEKEREAAAADRKLARARERSKTGRSSTTGQRRGKSDSQVRVVSLVAARRQ